MWQTGNWVPWQEKLGMNTVVIAAVVVQVVVGVVVVIVLSLLVLMLVFWRHADEAANTGAGVTG